MDNMYYLLAAWIGAAIISIAGFIQSAKYINKNIIVPFRTHVSNIGTVSSMAKDLSLIMPKLNVIVKMVLPNGGTSLSDKLDRVEKSIGILQLRHDKISAITEFNLYNNTKPCFQCNELGENIFINPSYCNLIGADSSALLGLGWRSFVYDLEDYDILWKIALKEGRSCKFDVTFIHAKTEEPIYCQCNITALQPGHASSGFLGLIDIVIPERGGYINQKK